MSDDVARLEEQRDVLLKSLRDLEQEREAGEIGDDDYAAIKDEYTARAAAVLKAIESARVGTGRRRAGAARPGGGGRRQPPLVRRRESRPSASQAGRPAGGRPGNQSTGTHARSDRPRSGARRPAPNAPVGRRPRTVAISVVVAFAIIAVAGMSVVLFAGGRTPGDPVTGSVPTTSVGGTRVDEALALETDGKAVEALKLYDEILASEPDNVAALAYRGWLLKRAGLPDEALVSLDRAVAVDPTFADAHFFRGMVLYQDRDDPAGAVLEFEAFLANNPPPDFVDAVGEVLSQARAAAAAKATTTATTTTAAP